MKIYCNQDNPTLDDFLNTDYWVKCYSNWGTFAEQEIYMKILDIYHFDVYNKDWIYYYACPDSTVEDGDLGMLTVEETLEDLEYRYFAPIDGFKICQPISVIPTEDLLEIIQSCDESPFARGY